MAHLDPHTLSARSLRFRLLVMFETPFDRRARRLSARVRALRALPDDELAARGLAREDILFHVFRGGR